MHGTTNIAYSPIKPLSPPFNRNPVHKKEHGLSGDPHRNGFRSPNSFQASPHLIHQKNQVYRDASYKSPPIHEFQLQNKSCSRSGIGVAQRESWSNMNNGFRKIPDFNMTPPYQSALKKEQKKNEQHLSSKPEMPESVKTPDNKNYPIKVQNQSSNNFQKVSAFFHSSPNLQHCKPTVSHFAILSPQNRSPGPIPKHPTRILEKQNNFDASKKIYKQYPDQLRGDKQELFSTYQSSKRNSYLPEQQTKQLLEAFPQNNKPQSPTTSFKPIKELILRPREVTKSYIIPDKIDSQDQSLKNKSKGKTILFMKSPQKLSHSQTINIKHSTSLPATDLPSKVYPISKPQKFVKKQTVNLHNSQKLGKIQKKQNITNPILMEHIKENGQSEFQDEDSVCMKKFTMEDFEIVEKIGRGNFGSVFLVREKESKMLCVLKCLSKNKIKEEGLEQHVMREIKIQIFLNHPHIAPLYGFFDDKQKIYLIMQYMFDGSLLHNKKKRTEKQIADILRQICSGLAYMHKENIIHRDIKPQNILMNQTYFKIGDLGCAVFSDSFRRTLVGCLAYISPEQLDEKPYDDKIDSWCIGIMAYELLVGRAPFQDHLKKKIIEKQDYSQFPILSYPNQRQISKDARDFIDKLLEKDPLVRYSMKEALKHSFLQKNSQGFRLPQ